MNRLFLIIIIIAVFIVSCRKLYSPDIETNRNVMVVEGFLTNRTNTNFVKLSYALPYDSVGNAKPISRASVYLTDNFNNIIPFWEYRLGLYIPEDKNFAGVLNRSYVLTIILKNGEEYNSSPQLLLPTLDPDSVYAGFNKEERLVAGNFGSTTKEVLDVCEIYYDIKSDNNTMPRFRFTSSQLIEYEIYKKKNPQPPLPIISAWFYCWINEYDNSLRFTNEKFATNLDGLHKQTTCVTSPYNTIYVRDMDIDRLTYMDTFVRENEYNRIISINQYRLNTDAYRFYKGIQSQSNAEGRIFDPLISQLYGNIKCKEDTTRLTLGFFEVSSVSTNSYSVRRNGLSEPIVIKKVNGPFLTSEGFTVNIKPELWINL